MKKILKKFIITILIIAILFNFSCLENVSFAGIKEDIVDIMGTFVGIITWLFRLPAIAIAWVMNVITAQVAYMDESGGSPNLTITPFEVLFNKIELLNPNFFNMSSTVESENASTYLIRSQVAKWFYVLRNISVTILLLILLYIGIRMAISSVADDKAKYKHALVDWIVSLALIFLLQFIIIFIVNINDALVATLANIVGENDEISDCIDNLASTALGIDIEAMGATVVYCMIVWQTFGLVLAYITRTIKLAFLIIISPLISITYAIDKFGDSKAQALNAWLKEFGFTILMQPFHCIIYMTLIDMAFSLLIKNSGDGMKALAASIIAILCIKFIKPAEELLKNIFAFDHDNSGTSIAAGTAAAAVGMKYAKNVGSTARKGVNFLKESKITSALKKDTTKIRAGIMALRESKADKEERKKLGIAKPSYAARVKQNEAKIEQKRADRREKFQNWKAHQTYKLANSKFSWKKYNENDKKEVQNIARDIKKQNPGMTSKEALKQARIKVSRQKIANGAYKSKTFNAVRGAAKAFNNLETVKYMKNTVIPTGFGLGTAFMAYGGDDNAFEAGAKGIIIANATKEFMKNSTGTLADTMAEQFIGKGITSSNDVEQAVMDIKVDGDNGAFDSDELKKIIEKLENAIGKAGAKDVRREIDTNFNGGKYGFDTEQLMKDSLKTDTINPAALSAAVAYKNFKHDSIIYQAIGNGENVGISTETLADKAGKSVDVEFNESQFMEMAKETVVSKEVVKSIKDKNGLDFAELESKFTNEISKIDKRIQKLEENLVTIGGTAEKEKARKNINKLKENKSTLEENLENIKGYEQSLKEGEVF